MTKTQLRILYKNKRNLLTKEEIKELSLSVFNLFKSNFNVNNKNIHTFFSIEKQNEIDMNYFNSYLFSNNCKVITSVTKKNPLRLEHSEIKYDTKFYLDSYNIPTPKNIIPFDIDSVNIVLVPLLVFDKTGNRVGYGKGLYDSFLKECNNKCIKIGLSLFNAYEDTIPSEPHDIKLDYCISPYKIFSF